MSQEMVRKILGVIGIITFVLVLSIPNGLQNRDSGHVNKKDYISIGQYNYRRYLEYLGPEVEPFEVTHLEAEKVYPYTEHEIYLVAVVVMSEVGTESFDVMQGLAEVVFNRVESNYKEFKYQNTVEEVIYKKYQFAHNQEPTQECFDAVYAALDNNAFPDDMLWARANYVSYGYEYTIDTNSVTKFSTVTKYQ